MFKRIYADNFRCLNNFELVPGQINLLLGENGSGKTSVLDVLQRLKDLVVGNSSAASLFAYTKTVWDQRDSQRFELEIETTDGTFTYRLEVRHPEVQAPQKTQIRSEQVDFSGKPLFRYADGQVSLFDEEHSPGAVFPFKSEYSFLPNLDTQNGKLQTFKRLLAGTNVFQLNPFAVDAFSQQDQPFLLIRGGNFASWLRYLSDERPEAKLECEKHLAELVPGFQRFRFLAAGDRKLLMADFSKGSGADYSLPINVLSEGHRILAMLYAIAYGMAGTASVLCFDEPENFVALPEVQPWLQCMRDLIEERGGQVFLVSHHPEVIDYLAADSAFRFERPGGEVARVSEWIPDPGEIMKPSEVLVRRG